MENDNITIIRDDADLIRRTMERLLSEEQLTYVPKQWAHSPVTDDWVRPFDFNEYLNDALLRELIKKRLADG